MANIYDVEGIDQFLPEPKKSLGSFLDDYATTAQEVSAPYVGMAGKYGFGNDPAKIQGLGSDVRHTTGSALGKFAIQDYLSQFGLQPSNPISNFIGNVGIMGSTAAQEIGDAVRGFRQAGLEGAINQPMEDVRANLRARDLRYGTPLEDIVNFAVASSPSAYMANPPAEPTISRFNAPGPFNYGTAQAAEVTPQNEPMDIEDFLGTSTPQDLGFIDNAPTIKEAIPLGISDRGRGKIPVDTRVTPEFTRPTMADVAGDIDLNLTDLGNPLNDPRVVSEEMGMVGFPGLGQVDRGFQDVLDAREARATQIANQQNPNYGQFFRDAPVVDTKSGLDLGTVLSLGGLLSGSNLAKAAGLIANRDKIGRMAGNVRSGLGSLGTKFAGKMRGINPTTGRPNTQAEYERARADRQAQNRTDRMIDRITSGKRTRSNPRDAGKTQAQKDAISAAMRESRRGGQYDSGGGDSPGGKSIVCTAMYQTTGLQDWKKAMKIWYIYQKKHLTDTHQEGYHWLFKPFVKAMKKSKIVEALGAHVAKHRTQELKHVLFNSKSDKLGKVYNMILEPICFIAGKIKSALGRG